MTDSDVAPGPPAKPPLLHTHAHEPNLVVPPGDGSFRLVSGARTRRITLAFLAGLPHFEIDRCFIVSTGHGVSGPFRFGGVRLVDLVRLASVDENFDHVDVVASDGYGTRLTRAEILGAPAARPPLLALTIDDRPLSREAGLVRLIVPTEVDDALKQIKWVENVAAS